MSHQSNDHQDPKDLYTIAIGASAGGMEAIHLLFDHTPEDGVAYVIIQHLSPDHKSFMAELLAKHSKLQISVAEDGMHVEPNRVYLMPQGKNMTIKGRALYLTDSRDGQPNTSIDIFLNSLAEDQADKSIAIILSGTGADGAKGIAAIKKNGGFVIVQDPHSAKFDGMPRSAIESGSVDVVLPPEEIPEEVIAYLKRDVLESNFSNEINEKDEDSLVRILNIVQENTPLDFSEYKRPTIIRRIVIRMTKNNLSSLKDYAEFLKDKPAEINILVKDFLISVTKFFRDKEAFEIISEKVIPDIVENKLQVDILKVWVVGCATGEEAYSLAILITEHLTELKKNLEVRIFASDVDKSAIRHASKGEYSEKISEDVSEDRLNKFFTKVDKKYKVRDNIRKMIIFADHDIVKQPPYGKIDLISCRNLLIYMNPILQKKILTSLHFCLNMGGYLFLGPSESLGDVKKSFTEVDKKWKIFKNLEAGPSLWDKTFSTPSLERHVVEPNHSYTPRKNSIKSNLTELTNKALLQESGYRGGVWVDTDCKIMQTCGDYEHYLLPKIFNFNLMEMLPEQLSIATSNALHKALERKQEVLVEKVQFTKDEKMHSVNVLVNPFFTDDTSVKTLILVLFSEVETNDIAEKSVEVFNMEEHTARHLEDMKEEVARTKQELREAYDALDVSNDNMSSYNEELISSNEEMQSTNEELQSVNEELQTVNNEYQLKIKELAELNDDLNNYFKSTINAQLYVDRDFVLRKFTPSAIRQVNLKDSDLGRPLSDISTNIRFSTLMDDIGKVISSSDIVKKEVQTIDGKWYHMSVMPYIKEIEDKNSGAIITFNDITELKRVQNRLSSMNADHATFISATAHDLREPVLNLGMLVSYLQDSIVLQTEEEREIMDLTIRSLGNLTEIITELTDISKMESDMDTCQNINLKNLLADVKLGMKAKLEESGVSVLLDFYVNEIPCSKKNLRSIITNILSNAIRYRSPERALEVTIKTEDAGDYVLLSIADNGLGIPEDKKDKIFGMFERAHQHAEGSGVGLYLVKKIVTNAGGDISVESELGKGSVFKVYFKKDPEALKNENLSV